MVTSALVFQLAARSAAAQPAASPPPSGLYEGLSPVSGAPVGLLSPEEARRLPRWLRVESKGDEADVVVEPGGLLTWRLRYGPHGLVSKGVQVAGKPWTESAFSYDDDGHLRDKRVTGPGAGEGMRFEYSTDPRGRPVERRRVPEAGDAPTRVTWTYGAKNVVVRAYAGAQLVRVDRLDPSGRLLRTEVGRPADGPDRLTLFYVRGARGRLLRVERSLGGSKRGPASHGRRDPTIGPGPIAQLGPFIERHEVLMLLGEPVVHTVDQRGERPTSQDGYSTRCWLNEADTVAYDPAELVAHTSAACICGFCVDAALEPTGRDVLQTDWHWTRGPWVRLDGSIDVVGTHRVLTPSGPRAASELRAGSAVLAADGSVRALESVQALPVDGERLGVNLRTRSGTFEAGGLLFESERPRRCGESYEMSPGGAPSPARPARRRAAPPALTPP